jgi:Fur family ferric uptake transcriptional regulator
MRLRLKSDKNDSRSRSAARLLREFLRGRGLRMTREREALLQAALACRPHFTLEELAQDVLRRASPASRATVYRALPILVEAGILQPALVTGEARLFETALGREHHDHLRCRTCGKIVEFRSDAIERLQVEIAARHGFRLASHVHELVGECVSGCRGSRKGLSAARGRRAEGRGRVWRRR